MAWGLRVPEGGLVRVRRQSGQDEQQTQGEGNGPSPSYAQEPFGLRRIHHSDLRNGGRDVRGGC
jgi:hypothetical protein